MNLQSPNLNYAPSVSFETLASMTPECAAIAERVSMLDTDRTIWLASHMGKAHRTGLTAFALAVKEEDPAMYAKIMVALLPYNDSIEGEE